MGTNDRFASVQYFHLLLLLLKRLHIALQFWFFKKPFDIRTENTRSRKVGCESSSIGRRVNVGSQYINNKRTIYYFYIHVQYNTSQINVKFFQNY